MKKRLYLKFIDDEVDAYVSACKDILDQGAKSILFRPFNQKVQQILSKIPNNYRTTFYVKKDECNSNPPENIKIADENISTDAILLNSDDPLDVSTKLLNYLNIENGLIVAPKTEHYYKNKALFLISIPKSGTHLLYRLAEAFGYNSGVILDDQPIPGNWYCLEYSNSHTSAKDFFIDTVRKSPLGNRHHPFPSTPAIFIYRNPLDILISEANYYHIDGKTLFNGYLNNRSFNERLLTLIDDPWLLGSIRDRIGHYLPWFEFQNVIPISFEELIGESGGGSNEVQRKLIWSLQLKLHIPGDPQDFGDIVFDKESPTFHEGRIGAFKKYFTEEAYKKFYNLPQDFMEYMGYDFDSHRENENIPKRTNEFRTRSVRYSKVSFDYLPILIESNFFEHNIVKYKSLYYGIPFFFGRYFREFKLEERSMLTLKLLLCDRNLMKLKQKISNRSKIPRILRKTFWYLCFKIECCHKIIGRFGNP